MAKTRHTCGAVSEKCPESSGSSRFPVERGPRLTGVAPRAGAAAPTATSPVADGPFDHGALPARASGGDGRTDRTAAVGRIDGRTVSGIRVPVQSPSPAVNGENSHAKLQNVPGDSSAVSYSPNSACDRCCGQMWRKRLSCKGIRSHHQQPTPQAPPCEHPRTNARRRDRGLLCETGVYSDRRDTNARQPDLRRRDHGFETT